jgi:hypothetical protein
MSDVLIANNTGTYDLGLIYMNARYYLPEVGRFISPDTLVPDPGNPQSHNWSSSAGSTSGALARMAGSFSRLSDAGRVETGKRGLVIDRSN